MKEAYQTAENSAGSAESENEAHQQSIQAGIDRTKASLQELSVAFLNTDFLKNIVETANVAVQAVTKLIDVFGGLGIAIAGISGVGLFKNRDTLTDIGSVFGGSDILSVLKNKKTLSNVSSVADLGADASSMFMSQFKVGENGISEFSKAQIETKASILGLTDSLTLETTAMAKDATLTDKIVGKKLTWGQALQTCGDDATELGKKLLQSGKLSEDATSTLSNILDTGTRSQINNGVKTAIQSVDGLSDSMIELESVGTKMSSASGLGTMFTGLATSIASVLPVIAVVGGAIAGITALYKAWDYSQTGYTRALDDVDSSSTDYSETKSELSSLNTELDETKSKIKELNELKNADGKLSLANQAELDSLTKTNEELERKISLKEREAQFDAQKVANDTLNASSAQESYTEYAREKYGGFLGTLMGLNADFVDPSSGITTSANDEWKASNNGDTSVEGQLKANTKKLEGYYKDLEDLQAKYANKDNLTESEIDAYKQQEDAINEKIKVASESASEQVSTLQNWIDSNTDEDGNINEKVRKQVDEWNKALTEYGNIGKEDSEKAVASLDTYFSSSSGSAMYTYLENLAKDGANADEVLQQLEATGFDLSSINVNADQFKQYFQDICSSAEETKKTLADYTASVSDVETATESENQDSDWSTIQSAYSNAKDLLKEGKTGTDDFQSMAKFLNPADVKKYAEQGGKYTADAYQKAFENVKATANRWFGEDETTSMENFVNDFKSKGLFDVKTDKDGLWDISTNFETTAEAAEKFGISVSAVETMLKALGSYGYDFSGIQKSGELLSEYKTNLESLKSLRDSMTDGDNKEELSNKISGWDKEYETYENDMSKLSEDVVVKIKFEYDKAQLEQERNELLTSAKNGATSDTKRDNYASAIAMGDQSIQKSKDQLSVTGIDVNEVDKIDEVAQAVQRLKEAKDNLANADENTSDADIIAMQQAVTNAQNALDDMYMSVIENPDMDISETINQAESDAHTIHLDADVSTEEIESQLNDLDTDTTLEFSANLDGDVSEISAIADEDGTITYTADVDGVTTQLERVKDEDGNISYSSTIDSSNVESAIKNLKTGNTIKFQANVAGVESTVSATRNVDGTISYHANMAGVQKDVTPTQNVDGKITYQPITSQLAPIQNTKSGGTRTVTYRGNTSSLPTSFSTITRKVNYVATGDHQLYGTAHTSGSAYASGSLDKDPELKSSWKTKQSSMSLTGEVGQELVVHGNHWWTVGDNGAEFTSIPSGSVVFNSKQTKELFKKGFTNSRGKGNPNLPTGSFLSGSFDDEDDEEYLDNAFLSGSAFRLGSGKSSSSSKKSSKSTKSSSKSSGKSSSNKKSNKKSTKSTKSTKSKLDKILSSLEKLFDWIEVRVERLEAKIKLAESKAENATDYKTKNNYIDSAQSDTATLITTQEKAQTAYTKKANAVAKKVGLSSKLKSKVDNGTIEIQKLSKKDKKRVEAYKEWYDKARDAEQAVEDLKQQQKELAQTKLDNIIDQYDSIVDLAEAAQKTSEAMVDYYTSEGLVANSQKAKDQIKSQMEQQSKITNEIQSEISAYAKAMVQVKTYFGDSSNEYREAKTKLEELTKSLYESQSAYNDLNKQLSELDITVIEYVIDNLEAWGDKLSNLVSLKETRGSSISESDYTKQIANNSELIQQYDANMNKYRETIINNGWAVGSEQYQEYAEKISKAEGKIFDLLESNEKLKQSIVELRWKPFDDLQEKLEDSIDDADFLRDLLNEDAFFYDDGNITSQGYANIALIGNAMATSKQQIADYREALNKVQEEYDNGNITLEDYNDRTREYIETIQDSVQAVEDYKDALVDMYKTQIEAENDALQDSIDKRKEALEKKKDYYDYDKTLKSKNKDVNSLKAQIAALEGVFALSALIVWNVLT